MPACEACHRAKVRCDQGHPACSRCVRRDLECVPRVSRQGQGPKKRKRHDNGLVKSEDERVLSHVDELGRHHYGVKYLVHSWISFAFARRSFALLSRASRLAAKCGISMDDIFCEQRRNILDPIMLHPAHDQKKMDDGLLPALQWSDLPSVLLSACSAVDESSRSQRYIMVREAKNGQSRYLLTEAFQRDIASLWMIEQTWKANDKPVVQVFLEGPRDFDLFTKAIGYQMSRYTCPNVRPECVRVNGLRVKMTLGSSVVQEMDLIYTFEIVTLDHSFYLSEFVAPRRQTKSNEKTKQTTQVPSDSFPLFDDLDDLMVDQDLESFLALISGD